MDIKNLLKDIWPGDVKIAGSTSKSALDLSVYSPDQLYRSARGSKCPEPPLYLAVPLHLITENPWDERNRLSSVKVADDNCVAAMRSLVTLVDPGASTLIPDRYTEKVSVPAPNTSGGAKPMSGGSAGGLGGGSLGGAMEAPSSHIIQELALALVSLNPEEGGGHAGWHRDLCVIFNTTRCPPSSTQPRTSHPHHSSVKVVA